MTLSNLVQQIEKILPDESEERILLVAKVIRSNPMPEIVDKVTEEHVRRAIAQLSSLDEQLSAAASELEGLAATAPSEFEPSNVWTLIRTIKVQSQMLELVYYSADRSQCETNCKN